MKHPRLKGPVRKLLFALALFVPTAAMVGLTGRGGERVVQDPESVARMAAEFQAAEAVEGALRQQHVNRERAERSARFAVRFRIAPLLADDIYWAAVRERIDPQLAFRLVSIESSFKSGAVSPMGAVGLTQVLPSTAKWLLPETRYDDLFVSRYNLRVGFKYLRTLIDTYQDPRLALLAYNRGPGTVDSLVEAGIDPANGYAHFILTGDRTPFLEYLESRRMAAAAGTDGVRRGT
jgi:soluble lytic murein transglycosylase-like protein